MKKSLSVALTLALLSAATVVLYGCSSTADQVRTLPPPPNAKIAGSGSPNPNANANPGVPDAVKGQIHK